jgi:galactokinase/galacturonokinase
MKLPIDTTMTHEERKALLVEHYVATSGENATKPFFLITVPLRICPLGAHSDHQGGIVTGFTIDRSVQLLGRSIDTPAASVASVNFNEQRQVSFADIPPKAPSDWGNYLRGSVQALLKAGGDLSRGFRGVIHGNMPIGGLSSSAAVSIAYLKALEHVNGLTSSSLETIMLVRAVENGYLGLHNGILDQSVIMSGKAGALTSIDCSTHTISSLDQGASDSPWEILIVYSGLSRQLIATPFNQRVAECHEAARELLRLSHQSALERPLLGQVSVDIFERYASKLPDHLQRRATHFFSERERVLRGMTLWSEGNIEGFGKLITRSGESSIVNFDSGSPALIALYEILADIPGVYGTRFCGGGFQGCCLALIDPRKRNTIAEALHAGYTTRHPELRNDYSIHICNSTNSVSLEVV